LRRREDMTDELLSEFGSLNGTQKVHIDRVPGWLAVGDLPSLSRRASGSEIALRACTGRQAEGWKVAAALVAFWGRGKAVPPVAVADPRTVRRAQQRVSAGSAYTCLHGITVDKNSLSYTSAGCRRTTDLTRREPG
jgi:hypothetical protein